jgi:hypothetical protein
MDPITGVLQVDVASDHGLYWLQGVEGDITRRPTIYEVIPTDYGFVAGSGREREDDLTFLPANVMIMPF